jgi:5-methylcytosine-specific restriction endonuclease McrA
MKKVEQHNETPREAYRRKLKDPRWQKMRLEIFNRDVFKCRYCGDKKETLHVHHLEYLPDLDPWQYPMESLITLWESCHEEETKYRREQEERLIGTLREIGFSVSDLDQFTTALGMAHFPCTKRDFVGFFDWFMTSTSAFEELLLDYHHGIPPREYEEVLD